MKRLILTAWLLSLPAVQADQASASICDSLTPLDQFRGTPSDVQLQDEYEFLRMKYAEYLMEFGPCTHVFNPSHTLLIFISLEPPAGRNTYHFYVYEKKDLGADGLALYKYDQTIKHEWSYKGEYVFSSPYDGWDFANIIFEGKSFSIIIKTDEGVYKHSFDYSKAYDEFVIE